MTPLDRELVRRKLALITRNLDDLQRIDGLALEVYSQDRFLRKATERLLQELIEAAVDVNTYLLRAADAPTPGDYHSSFMDAGRQGIIPTELAARLAPAAGLRNRLVHEYDRIDDAMVLAAVTEARSHFAAFVAAVEHWLARDEGADAP